MGSYTPEEYKEYKRKERVLDRLRREGRRFRELRARAEEKGKEVTREEIEEERARRMRIAELSGEAMGFYGGNPEWDDVVPIPQDDGEGALAAIAYNDEYAEGILRPRSLSFLSCHFPLISVHPNYADGSTSNVLPPRSPLHERTLTTRSETNNTHHNPQCSTLHGLAVPLQDPTRPQRSFGPRIGMAQRRCSRQP